MATYVNPTFALSHSALHHHQLRLPKLEFVNHTPRDFEITAAISAISAQLPTAATSFRTMLTPLEANFGLSDVGRSTPPQPSDYTWTLDEKKDMVPRVPLMHGSKFLQPRDAKVSPDHTAADVAYFLRDTRPPQYEFTELEPPAKSPATEKLRRILKLGSSRSPEGVQDSHIQQLKLRNVVEKTSLDGTKYLQIIPHHPYFLDPPVHELTAAYQNAELDIFTRECDASLHTSRSDLSIGMNELVYDPTLIEKDRKLSETVAGAYEAGTKPVNFGKDSYVGNESISKSWRTVPQCTRTPMPRSRPVVPYDEYLNQGLPGLAMSSPECVTAIQDGGNELSFQSSVPQVSTSSNLLPPVPESRVVSLGTSDTFGNVVQMICQNGQPYLLENTSKEAYPNQGRRMLRERTSPGLQPFPVSPSRIPPRQESLKALTGSISAEQMRILSLSTSGGGDADQFFQSVPIPISQFPDVPEPEPKNDSIDRNITATPPSGSESMGKRADRTRARKLRDLQQTRERKVSMTKASHEKLSQILQTDWLGPGNIQASLHVAGNEETFITPPRRVHNAKDSIKKHGQRSKSLPEDAIPKTIEIGLLQPQTLTTRVSLPFPLPPCHLSPGTSNGALSPHHTVSEMDTHPAFRQRSPTPTRPTRTSTEKHPSSSLPTLSRAGTPLGHGSFYSSPSFRGRESSPTFTKEAHIQAQLDNAERKNKLLNAALLAVLKTAGYLNGCPCGGQGGHLANGAPAESKRESEASASTTISGDGSDPDALELYMSTRRNLSKISSMKMTRCGDDTGYSKSAIVHRHDVPCAGYDDPKGN